MGSWTREQLIARVQARIDESGGQGAVLTTSVIGQELDDAARAILSVAPRSHVYLVATSINPTVYVPGDDQNTVSVVIPLPPTFLRFLRVKLSNWTRSQDTAIEAGTPDYERQYYFYDRAPVNRPAVAIVPFKYGSNPLALECFPPPVNLSPYNVRSQMADGTAIIETSDAIGGKGTLLEDCLILNTMPAQNIPDSLVDATLWMAAARCLTMLRVQEGSRNAMAHYKEAMPAIGGANG